MSPKAKPKSAPPTSCNSCWHRSGRDALHQRHGVFRLQDLGLQPHQVAVDAQHRRLADRNVQVARLAVDDRLQQFVDQNSSHDSTLPARHEAAVVRPDRSDRHERTTDPSTARDVSRKLVATDWSPMQCMPARTRRAGPPRRPDVGPAVATTLSPARAGLILTARKWAGGRQSDLSHRTTAEGWHRIRSSLARSVLAGRKHLLQAW